MWHRICLLSNPDDGGGTWSLLRSCLKVMQVGTSAETHVVGIEKQQTLTLSSKYFLMMADGKIIVPASGDIGLAQRNMP